MKTIWGIHNDALTDELVDEGFVSIGWEIGDIRAIGSGRTQLKEALERRYPDEKPGAYPVWAGILLRFAFEMEPGDIVIAPNKRDSTLNFGRIVGPYEFEVSEPVHPHRRRVEWLNTGVSRGLFPQKALYEIGSALTLFRVKNNVDVFNAFLTGNQQGAIDPQPAAAPQEAAEEWAEDEPSATRLEQFAHDTILKALLEELSHEEFEHFTADLLRAMGYQARVTPFSSDGGIDVIAHRDPLGLEPPQIKVQCKHTAAQQSRPDVQRLSGTLAQGEMALFVCLGNYTREALGYERERQNLRLLTGADVVDLTLKHYDLLPAKWRVRMPLRQVYVVDRVAEGR